jgi:hypothetical protein
MHHFIFPFLIFFCSLYASITLLSVIIYLVPRCNVAATGRVGRNSVSGHIFPCWGFISRQRYTEVLTSYLYFFTSPFRNLESSDTSGIQELGNSFSSFQSIDQAIQASVQNCLIALSLTTICNSNGFFWLWLFLDYLNFNWHNQTILKFRNDPESKFKLSKS